MILPKPLDVNPVNLIRALYGELDKYPMVLQSNDGLRRQVQEFLEWNDSLLIPV